MATNKLYFVAQDGTITEVNQTRGGVLIEVNGKVILANVYNNQDHTVTILEEQKVVPVETVESIIHPPMTQQTQQVAGLSARIKNNQQR